ncbi:hypothetical protein [Clostridium estertheticum]|uniref:hypothetical protein n=1 Tax=Clostridium estertheticum TaxID=238834 RepID=UPI001CF5FBAF|nr:hypothetical protein [Clostridium estertheticum]MCB2361135.1 hypothetical protein [Clostridium estertheticum]
MKKVKHFSKIAILIKHGLSGILTKKISTYVNALAKAGFVIEQLIEQRNDETFQLTGELSD